MYSRVLCKLVNQCKHSLVQQNEQTNCVTTMMGLCAVGEFFAELLTIVQTDNGAQLSSLSNSIHLFRRFFQPTIVTSIVRNEYDDR
jgi:hypothetical protein